MKQFIYRLLIPFQSRRATGFSVLGFVALFALWFQFFGEDTEAELSPPIPPSAASGNSAAPVSTGDFELDEDGSQQVILASATEEVSSDPETRQRDLLAGNWEDEYHGKRSLSVSRDGTGAMVVDLDGIGKRLFAPRLSFQMEWSLADGYVTMKTLGGEPKSKADLVLKMYGNEARYKILELTADRLLLLDGDGKTQYDWRRPSSSSAAAAELTGASSR